MIPGSAFVATDSLGASERLGPTTRFVASQPVRCSSAARPPSEASWAERALPAAVTAACFLQRQRPGRGRLQRPNAALAGSYGNFCPLSAHGGQTDSRPSQISRRGLQTGIVGLPNVGKSTLFNALCDQGEAEAGNFPFCTINPNMGKAKVPDSRLDKLASIASSEKVISEMIEYVDIAGLVKGAANGEGLGNKFLGNIRMCDAIVHVVRCFEDADVIHVDGSVDPVRDIETITLELIFADSEQCEKRMVRVKKDVTGKVKGAAEEQSALQLIMEALEAGKPARTADLDDAQLESVKHLSLLTMKPMLFATNVSEDHLATGNDFVKAVQEFATENGDEVVMVSAQVEAELKGMDEADKVEYLESLGVEESGCSNLVNSTYRTLGLRTYFTCGPQESRAWTIKDGWKAPQAAGVIHSDFEKGFIKAATVSYEDFVEVGSEEAAAAKGKLRMEGKDYVVKEGDVIHFRFK